MCLFYIYFFTRYSSRDTSLLSSLTELLDKLITLKGNLVLFKLKLKFFISDSQSSTVSGLDDSQEASGALSKRLRMYKCERCNTQYMGLAMLRQHCRDVHGDQKYYKCHVCGKLFSHPSSRNIHLRLHSGEKPYKCSTCGKQFRVSSHLKDHVRVHTGELHVAVS